MRCSCASPCAATSMPKGMLIRNRHTNVTVHVRGPQTMRGRLGDARSVLSGKKATKKATQKKTSSVLRTTGTGTVSTVSTVYTVVGFPKTTDAPNPTYTSCRGSEFVQGLGIHHECN